MRCSFAHLRAISSRCTLVSLRCRGPGRSSSRSPSDPGRVEVRGGHAWGAHQLDESLQMACEAKGRWGGVLEVQKDRLKCELTGLCLLFFFTKRDSFLAIIFRQITTTTKSESI